MLASQREALWKEVVEQKLAALRYDTEVRRQLWMARRPKRHWLSQQIRQQITRLGRACNGWLTVHGR